MAKAYGKKPTSSKAFQVKPLTMGLIASVVLEELSREYGHLCNYLEAASLARQGDVYLALQSVLEANARVPAQTPETVWVYAQAEAVLKKLVDPALDRWPATEIRWFATEKRCERLNKKFAALHNRRIRGEKSLPYAKEIYRFYEALVYALGDEPPLQDILELSHYGPGSSTDVRGSQVHYARKIESNECTPAAVELGARSLALDKAIWEQHGLRPEYATEHNSSAYEGAVRVIREALSGSVNDRDRLLFIHKGIESMRSIGAQPTVSGHLQLGVHSVGVEILQRVGIDLSSQKANQLLAFHGSLHWRDNNPWCTLDKSDASNLIAAGLVTYTFPPAWAKLLGRLRTPRYEAPPQLGGATHTYHMYAGMGNGTTFFVETLIFWAASYATSDSPSPEQYVSNRPYAIYGDDVVLRRDHALAYMPFAKFLGFRFNSKKTFLDGPFRESCGADYYEGVNVRAAYLNSESTHATWDDVIGLHNTLADQPSFKLPTACRRLRELWRNNLYPITPTDPQGQAGFRPIGRSGYSIVRDKSGKPTVSAWWQRPRYYIVDKKTKMAGLGEIGVYTQLAVAAMRARQSEEKQIWSLPMRDAVTSRVTAEVDMSRRDLVQMLQNQFAALAQRMAQPWWKDYRGQ